MLVWSELLGHKRKQLPQLLLARPPAVFADFERLGMANLVCFFLSVPLRQLISKPLSDSLASGRMMRSELNVLPRVE